MSRRANARRHRLSAPRLRRYPRSRRRRSIGATFSPRDEVNFYISYMESARATTPIESSCNEGVFEVARQFSLEDGDDPNEVDFECRLPNAFLADPPLAQVVARSIEAGVRGELGNTDYRLGVFRTQNNDDIIFQSTGRSTGLFANVDETRREGVELGLAGSTFGIEWFTAYSCISATFESRFEVLTPNHPAASARGTLQVEPGNRVPGIPRHQLKVGGDYDFDAGFSLGLEVLYNSDRLLRGDEANLLETIAGYALVNLRARYSVNETLEVFGRVTNLFNTEYENFGLLGEDPAEVLPGLSDDSPVFLGAGPPLAGWVGVRLRY
ncbi:MAG: TonB-dependent receptor [Gammaproteobacteria bacterium]|nr:TonB-dependent receptor [Gammaproteobacteria bacterium]